MPSIVEMTTSQSGFVDLKTASIDTKWLVFGWDDFIDTYAYVESQVPATYYGLPQLRVSLEPLGALKYYATVTYGVPDAEVADDPNSEVDTMGPEYAFDTTAATVHITQSLATVTSTDDAGNAAPNTMQAIGVTREGVQGADIYAGKLELSCTYNFPYLSLAYVQMLRKNTPCTNAVTTDLRGNVINGGQWRGFNPAELIFLGATGQFRQSGGVTPDTGGWSVTFKFAAGYNVSDLAVSPAITIPTKAAWDYLWVSYADAIANDGAGLAALIQQPKYAYVERVYNSFNFYLFNLPN